MTLVVLVHPLSADRPDGRLRIDFLDVGQGDAVLLTMPDGTTLLVDGGGRRHIDARSRMTNEVEGGVVEPDRRGVGEAVVSEFLWWRGLDHVDYIMPTHADADHIDGLNDIALNFNVRAALVARAPLREAEFARFAANANRRGVPLYAVGRGDTLRFGEVVVDVLWPPRLERSSAMRGEWGNNDSIVLRVRFGRRVFLLTGDIETDAEAALVATREDLRADAVKVAHHGSRTSSTTKFVETARASFAIISVGRDSPYGHPHRTVVERWRASGARVLTTGECGTVTLSTDGNDLRMETLVCGNSTGG